MRRALLLAALAAPVVASAQQTPRDGDILFSQGDDDTDYVRGHWISKAECENPAATLKLSWDIALTGAFPAPGTYEVFASDRVVPNDATGCYTQPDQTVPVIAGPVGIPIAAEREAVNFQVYEIKDVLAAVQITTCPTTNKEVFVCVQLKGAAVVGLARGTLTISTTAPAAPTEVGARPADDGALEITWKGPTTDPRAYDYNVTAVSTDARDTTPHTATEVSGQHMVMSGLVNDVPYTINVYSVSEAGNVSAKSTPDVIAKPGPVLDLWEIYRELGGVDDGGCASGPAGPLALVFVAGLLAALRRRRA